MAITKPTISSLVSGQLPEFIRADYQIFVAFLEAYYEYLESQIITDLTTVGDIDSTLDSFVEYFKNQLAINFPKLSIDDKFLLPKIKQLYTAKGSEASYRLLFRLLYNKEINIKYPSSQILKTSDGKWVQEYSFFVQINRGSADDIVGKTVKVITNTPNPVKLYIFVQSYKSTSDSNIFEFFYVNNYGTFNVGDVVDYGDIFTGIVQATTTNINILQAGKNFKIGQLYNITGAGAGSIIKVTSVDSNGGIKTAKFINFGIGYPTSFTINILAQASQFSTTQNNFEYSGTSPAFSVGINDSVDYITDIGTINLYNYSTNTYVDNTYAGAILKTFSDTTSTEIIDPLEYCILNITLGASAKYPGYYKNNEGFLSDNIYLQDGKYYQTFSYVLEVDELFISYKSIVKNILHPSGTAIFGEHVTNNTLNPNIKIALNTNELIGIFYNLITEQDNFTLTTEDDNTIIVNV